MQWILLAKLTIRQAQAVLHAANAEYGVAITKLYPQFNLSANLGSQALSTGALFGSGSAVWSLVGQLTRPLFDPGLPAEKRAALAAAGYVQLLTAQQQSQQTRINLIGAQARRLVDSAALYQAMGGGRSSDGETIAKSLSLLKNRPH